MRKRDWVRYLPVFSRLVRTLELVESHNRQLLSETRQLRSLLHQLIFTDGAALVEPGAPEQTGEENVPIPPAALRYLVAHTEDLDWFLRLGKLGAQTIVDTLAKQGKTLDQFPRVLDFGCGCGRVLRYLKDIPGIELHGTDCNATAIQWGQQHLPFAKLSVNSLEPPLAYPDGMFNLIYVFSIFTHLTESLQLRWLDELRRVLVPGGYVILTLHGDKNAESLYPAERREYQKGNLVVREANVVGSNYCMVYHPESYVRRVLTRGFEVIDFVPEGGKGNGPQDAYLLRSCS